MLRSLAAPPIGNPFRQENAMTLIESFPTTRRLVPKLPHEPADPRTVVWVRGEQDICTAAVLWERLEGAIACEDADLVLDMSGVTFLDASTIGVVVRACRHLRQRSRSLAVRSPSRCARRVLEICDLAFLIGPADRTSSVRRRFEPERD
jgi:anti-sigma B factor antagonist